MVGSRQFDARGQGPVSIWRHDVPFQSDRLEYHRSIYQISVSVSIPEETFGNMTTSLLAGGRAEAASQL